MNSSVDAHTSGRTNRLAEGVSGASGWLFALADRRMRKVITAMHSDPERRWTLHSLAKLASISRTTFSVTFKKMVGRAPLEYLTQWQMMLAGDRMMMPSLG